ncbi:MAG: X-Pro dipeptidyl-peptidase, partial [Solirubrobacteraceae bacterium]|nr:X-Pro dipeptidyl-peptidase [Solirubrobacteraceae bacterium]
EFGPWWAGLAASGVPRKLWLLREGHVDPFDSRRAVWVDTLHRWFDRWLYDIPNGIMNDPRVDIEDSKDTWNTYADWPLPTSENTDVYLQGTSALTAGATGLSTGGAVDSVSFVDNPMGTEALAINTPTGQQTARRVFLSSPLTQPLRVSGTPLVSLQGSLSTTQSNLSVTLVDYGSSTQITRAGEGISNTATSTCWGQHPTSPDDFSECYLEVTKPTTNVTSWRVSRGILDSSNRDSLRTPAPVTMGAATLFPWPLLPADYTFPAGHQIGIVITGDNTGYPSVAGTPASTITVDTRLSRVSLPVVGGYPAARRSGAFTADTTAPALTVSPNVSSTTADPAGADVAYAAATATDNEDPHPEIACDHASGSHFAAGDTTVTCTATDVSGNVATKSFVVSVTGTSQATATATVTTTPTTTTPTATATVTAAPTSTPTAMASPQPPIATIVPIATPITPPTGGDITPIVTPPPTLDTRGDVVAPAVLRLRAHRARHRVKIRFSISEAATVVVTVKQHGHRAPLRHVTRRLSAGRHRVILRGTHLGHHRYRVTVRAIDAAGNAGRKIRVLRARSRH